MLTRCPDCQKLYPQHHGGCRNCQANPPAAIASSVPPPAPRPAEKLGPRPRLGALRSEKTPEPPPPEPPKPKASSASPYPDFPLEETQIEFSKKKQEKALALWNTNDGGICPSCSTFNPASNAFCGACSVMLLRSEEVDAITSYPLNQVKGLLDTFVQKLATLNIKTTEDMLRVGINPKNRQMIAAKTGISERSLLRLVHTSDFCRIPSVDLEKAAMLELIAVVSLDALLKAKPEIIYQKIQQAKMAINKQGILVLPTKNQVAQWFEEAEQLPMLKIV